MTPEKSLLCSVPEMNEPPIVFEKVLQLNTVGVSYACISPSHFPEHSDPNLKIGIPLNQVSLNVKWQTASGRQKSQSVKEGHISIVTPNLPHETWLERQMDMIIINLAPGFMGQVAEDLKAKPMEIREQWAARDSLIQQLGRGLLREFQHGMPGRLYVESVGNVLATHLFRHYCTDKLSISEQADELSPQKLRQAIEYINEHLEQDVTLADLAKLVQMSQYRFARAFKNSTGLPPHQYLLECRVQRAQVLLAQTQLSIAEISYSLGFSSQSHFTATFRRFTATTPKAYREAL